MPSLSQLAESFLYSGKSGKKLKRAMELSGLREQQVVDFVWTPCFFFFISLNLFSVELKRGTD